MRTISLWMAAAALIALAGCDQDMHHKTAGDTPVRTTGGTVAPAVAVDAGVAAESDPIRRYGVPWTDTSVNKPGSSEGVNLLHDAGQVNAAGIARGATKPVADGGRGALNDGGARGGSDSVGSGRGSSPPY